MPPRRALLVVNPDKPSAVQAAGRVEAAIRAHGELAGICEGHRACADRAGEADVVVALGGDGTILALARRLVGSGKPLLGVDFGRVGFLAEFDLGAFLEQAPTLFDAGTPLAISERPLIEAVVRTPEGDERARGSALNEAAVAAGPPFRMIEVGLSIGGEPGPVARGDGVLVSTPFGSTAYNASAGGPIIVPGLEALAVTPIAAHSLAFRPIVAPNTSRIELRLLRANAGDGGGTTLVLDGQELIPLTEGDTVELFLGDRRAPLVRNPGWSYWRTLMEKLHWGVPPNNGSGGPEKGP